MTQTAPVLIQPTPVNHSGKEPSQDNQTTQKIIWLLFMGWVCSRVLCVVAKLPALPDNYSTSCPPFYASSLPWIGPPGLWREDSSYFTPGADTLVKINMPLELLHEPKGKGWITPHLVRVLLWSFLGNWVVDSNIVEDERSYYRTQVRS